MRKTVNKSKALSPIKTSFKVRDPNFYAELENISKKKLVELLQERNISIPKTKDDMISLLGMWIEYNCKTVSLEIL